MKNFDTQVTKHLAAIPDQMTSMLSANFKRDTVVAIEHLLPPACVRELHSQANRLLRESATRRDLELAVTGGTPRNYLSVGREAIHAERGAITQFFECDAIRDYLSKITGEPMHRVPYEPEEYIINSQEKSGDTHGWHWDDYTFALIWIVEAPGVMNGGRVEYIADTTWDKEDPKSCLEQYIGSREIHSRYVRPGTCYLMRANTTLHRVAPLSGDTRRTVIVFTYASESDLRDGSISHETMEEIYSPELTAA